MRDAAPQTIYLADYTPFGFDVDEVHLTFDLAPSATHVRARIRFSPKPDATDRTFFLHGEDLTLLPRPPRCHEHLYRADQRPASGVAV